MMAGQDQGETGVQLHRCQVPAADNPGGAGVVRDGRGRCFTVDVHAHALVPAVEALVRDRPEKRAEPEAQRRAVGAASADYNATTMRPTVFPKLTSVEERLRDMDAMGVDVQVVSPTSLQHYYWADPDLARQIVAVGNEALAEQCARHPDRLVGLGNIALQHPELAVEQLEHAVRALGLRGVEISTAINGAELDDPAFARFWAKAEELGCVVFIHPADISSLGERLSRFYLQNIVGRPIETTIALSHLIFGGVLDRHPGLKILAAHGGGYLPFYPGRSDHGHAVRPEAQTMQQPPSAYLRRIHFDSLVYGPESLGHLIANVGAGQVVAGTDYPYDMGAYDVHGLIAAVAGLDEAQRAAILGGNAVRLFGLEAIAARHAAGGCDR
jgi:aminocarboxymuconate-semialdehyde decarboxylase